MYNMFTGGKKDNKVNSLITIIMFEFTNLLLDFIIKKQERPSTGDVEVWPLVVKDLMDIGVNKKLLDDIEKRRKFGIIKYGTPLMTNNGRDPGRDAYEEILDYTVYCRQRYEENRSASNCSLYKNALGLLNEESALRHS